MLYYFAINDIHAKIYSAVVDSVVLSYIFAVTCDTDFKLDKFYIPK